MKSVGLMRQHELRIDRAIPPDRQRDRQRMAGWSAFRMDRAKSMDFHDIEHLL
jgi:hypothetical protein